MLTWQGLAEHCTLEVRLQWKPPLVYACKGVRVGHAGQLRVQLAVVRTSLQIPDVPGRPFPAGASPGATDLANLRSDRCFLTTQIVVSVER